MPTFTFKDDKGEAYEVHAPEGATEGQAFEKFQKALWKSSRRQAQVPEGLGARMAAEENNPAQAILANIGAGMTNLVQGGAQVLNRKKPGSFLGIEYDPTDRGVENKRATDAALAEGTTGGGALQLAGEIIPTLAIPAGAAVQGTRALAQGSGAVARAITGAVPKAAATVAPAAGRTIASMSADAALTGAATGALMPRTSDESRTGNALLAGGISALAPGVLALGGKLISMLSAGGARSKAADEIIQKLGGPDEAKKVIDQIKQYHPNAYVEDIPLSVGETTLNPTLAAMERTSQAGPARGRWTEFRGEQAARRAEALDNITSHADELPARVDARKAATEGMREKALARAGKDPFFTAPVAQHLDALESGNASARVNPAGKKVVSYMREVLEAGTTPQDLYEARKLIVGKLHGPHTIGDELGAAIKGADKVSLSIRDAIDDALDASTNGKWRKYLTKFKDKSAVVQDAAAAKELRDIFNKEGAARIATNDNRLVPSINGRTLGNAIDNIGKDEFGQTFSDRTMRGLEALRENIGRTEGLGLLVRKGSGGAIEETTGEMLAGTAKDATVPPLSKAQRAISHVVNFGSNLEKAAMADALRNPERFVQIVEKKLAKGQPLKPTEEFILNTIRAISVSPGVATVD